MLKRFLYAALYCLVILAVAYGITVVLGALPVPFTEILITVVWIVAVIAVIWIMGRLLIDLIPSSAP